MRLLDLLVIGSLALFWYALVPIGGAFWERRRWRRFRQRFDELRFNPILNYTYYSQGNEGRFRFFGGFESVTDGHTLWLRGADLTISVSLAGAQTYMLSMQGPASASFPGERAQGMADALYPENEAPVPVKWNQISALTGEARVFVGGQLLSQDNRLAFASVRDFPLLVIFFTGQDRMLTPQAIQAGRNKNEYWNRITPYSFILGAFSFVLLAFSYIRRPLFRLTLISAFSAAFIPLFPLIPPGFLFTLVYRWLWQRARSLRVYRDLATLPVKYFPGDTALRVLPDGDIYAKLQVAPGASSPVQEHIPLVIPAQEGTPADGWYCFGALDAPLPESGGELPPLREPRDPCATFGAVPGNPEGLARKFTIKAYMMETVSWVFLLGGICVNILIAGLIILSFI